MLMLTAYVLWYIKYTLMISGALVSQLDGFVTMDDFKIGAEANQWSTYNVLAIYLLPLVILLLLLTIVGKRYHFPIRRLKIFRLFKAWLYTCLIIIVYFESMWDLVLHNGIFYSISWLGFTELEQYALVLILLILFINGTAKLGPFFAVVLQNGGNISNNKPKLIRESISLIILPATFMILVLLGLGGFAFNSELVVYMIGIIISSGVAYWQILRYDVIID